jgi:hypothetical protein
MHREGGRQLLQELPPHRLSLRRIRTGWTVRQLDQRHDRKGHFFTACAPGDFR